MKSLVKRWSRRYFRAQNGELFYYPDNKQGSKSLGNIRLRGSEINYAGKDIIEILDAKNGTRMTLRTKDTKELERWKTALDKETNTNYASGAATVSPAKRERAATMASESRRAEVKSMSQTLIFDIGGCSVRAGFAGGTQDVGAAWPELYFPAVVSSKDGAVGFDALVPESRRASRLTWPLRNTDFMEQGISTASLETIYGKIFKQLEVDPSDYNVIMTEPQMCSDKDRQKIAEIMFETYNVQALCIKPQPLLAMYSYGATTGVVVDIGERLDIFPLDSGYMFEKGVSKLRYGGHVITEQMQRLMSEEGHRFFSPVEAYIARHVKERIGYVAKDYHNEIAKERAGEIDAGIVDCRRFAVPDGTKTFRIAGPRFRAPEGLFDPNMFGKDNEGLGALVHKAITSAPIDLRKAMARNIYLSGGATRTKGLAARLTSELEALLPRSCAVSVHEGQYREHAAYRGAAVVASLDNFEAICVDQDDWHEVGASILQKFQMEVRGGDDDNDFTSSDESDGGGGSGGGSAGRSYGSGRSSGGGGGGGGGGAAPLEFDSDDEDSD